MFKRTLLLTRKPDRLHLLTWFQINILNTILHVCFLATDLMMGNLQRCLTIPFMAQWVDHEGGKTISLLQILTSPSPKQTLMLTVRPLFRPLAIAPSPVQKPNLTPQTPWAAVYSPRSSPRSLWCLLALKGAWLGPTDLRFLWSLALVSHKSFNQSLETTETAQSSHPRYDHKPDQVNPKMVWSLYAPHSFLAEDCRSGLYLILQAYFKGCM